MAKRQRELDKNLKPVVFKPVVRDPLKPQTQVKMLRTVGGKFHSGDRFNLDFGKKYWLDKDKADEYILKGYAEGELSRKYSDDEVAEIRSTVQTVVVPTGPILEET